MYFVNSGKLPIKLVSFRFGFVWVVASYDFWLCYHTTFFLWKCESIWTREEKKVVKMVASVGRLQVTFDVDGRKPFPFWKTPEPFTFKITQFLCFRRFKKASLAFGLFWWSFYGMTQLQWLICVMKSWWTVRLSSCFCTNHKTKKIKRKFVKPNFC